MGLIDTRVWAHGVQRGRFVPPAGGFINFVVQSNIRTVEEDVKGGLFAPASSGADKNSTASFKNVRQPDGYCFAQAQSHHPLKPSAWPGWTLSPRPLRRLRFHWVCLAALGLGPFFPPSRGVLLGQARSCHLTETDCTLRPPLGEELLPTAVQGELVVHILGGKNTHQRQ